MGHAEQRPFGFGSDQRQQEPPLIFRQPLLVFAHHIRSRTARAAGGDVVPDPSVTPTTLCYMEFHLQPLKGSSRLQYQIQIPGREIHGRTGG
jgi:hypothetical protein